MKRRIMILGLAVIMTVSNHPMAVSGLDDFYEESWELEDLETFDESSGQTDIEETDTEAADTGVSEETESMPEEETEDEQAFEEELLLEETFEINPVLADVPVNDYEVQSLYEAINQGSRTYQETTEECVQALRQAMLNRENVINIYYVGDAYKEGYAKELQDMAVSHDLSLASDTGDYLRYHYKSVNRRTFRGSTDQGVYYRFEYSIAYLSTQEQEELVTEAVGSIMSSLELSGDMEKKIGSIYRYVTANVVYDATEYEDFNVHSAYAAVIQGRSVCQGYAAMLYRMLREAGINCRIIGGRAGSVNHAWVMAEIDDSWYFLDPTWDAGIDTDDWRYYLIGSRQFFEDHIWEDAYQSDPLFATYEISEENYFHEEPLSADEAFLESLYLELLGRHSDPGGLAYWKDKLETGALDSLGVLCGFLNSREFSKKDISQTDHLISSLLADDAFVQYAGVTVNTETLAIVVRCYNRILNRQPELGGFRYWCRKLDEAHISYKALFKGFIFSPERTSKPLDDEAFIEMLYRAVLNREPDADEMQRWQQKCLEGMSRELLFEAFTDTDEYHQLYP